MKKKKLSNPSAVPLFTITQPNASISEEFRTLRTNIQFSKKGQDMKSIVVTSSIPGEGKSTVAANLAVAFAQSGNNVLLVDADMRRPTAHLTFELPNNMGLTNLLSVKQLSIGDVVQHTNAPNLSILTSGPKSPHPSELLASSRMTKVMNILEQLYDIIIYDMPPVAKITDAQLVASHADGVILVVREGVADKRVLLHSKSLLNKVKADIIGAVFVGKTQGVNGYYNSYYGVD